MRYSINVKSEYLRSGESLLVTHPSAKITVVSVSSRWWQGKEQGGSLAYWGMRLMLAAHNIGGRPLFVLILYPVMAWFFMTSTSARQASQDYLRRLKQSDPVLQLQPSLLLSWRHFLSFADIIFDKLNAWTGRISPDSVHSVGRESMLARLAQGQGGVMLSAHLGNLEVMQALSAHNEKLVLNVLVHTRHAEQFNRVLALQPRATVVRLIQVETLDAALAVTLSARVDAGEWIVVAADRVPLDLAGRSRVRTVDVDFLGHSAALPLGPHLLAMLLGCPLVFVTCLKLTGQYHIYFETLAEKIIAPRAERNVCLQQSVQQYADRLAYYCQLAPLQWFNFYSFWHDHDSN